MVNEEWLAMLRCPMSVGKAPLELQGDALVCPCGVRYAIEDGIPNMLIEEATLPPGCPSVEALDCPHAPRAAATRGQS